MSDAAHGILTLRASARLHARARLPAGERGDAAERGQPASWVLWGQRERGFWGHGVCRGERSGEVEGDGCGGEGFTRGARVEGVEVVRGFGRSVRRRLDGEEGLGAG